MWGEAGGEKKEQSVDGSQAILEPLKPIPDMYRRQSEFNRACLMSVLAWNCQLGGETVLSNHRNPFDLVAEELLYGHWYAWKASNQTNLNLR
jgi:hypothetical protein